MKNIIICLFVSMISLISCNLSSSYSISYDDMYLNNIKDHSLFYDDSFSSISSVNCIGNWLDINMDYVRDEEDCKKWLDPSISFYRGYDDCSGFSMVFLNVAYMEFDEKYSLIFVNQFDLYDINPKNFNHVLIVENGYVMNAQLGIRYTTVEKIRPKGEYLYSFDEIFNY